MHQASVPCPMHRVVVTGLGCATPLGLSVPELWTALLAGRVATKNIADSKNFVQLAASTEKLPCRVFAPIEDLPQLTNMNDKLKYPRSFKLAEIAASEALKQASKGNQNIGVYLGWGMPGVEEVYDCGDSFSSPRRISPYLIPSILGNSPASFISRRFGLQGPLSAPSLACATGSYAIGEAFRFLRDERNHECDAIIAGATEAPLNVPSITGFSRVGALATGFNDRAGEASRPFCQYRNGFVMGEGAGMVLLERLDAAIKRNANIYAEIVGFSSISDAHHPTAPDPQATGAKKAISNAIAGIDPEFITGINAHATSTPVGDEIELEALNELFPKKPLIISSNKGNFGHLLGAGSAVEAIITVLGMHHEVIPSTVNVSNPLKTHHKLLTKNHEININGNIYWLKTAFGFGGVNVALCFRKWRPSDQGAPEP